MRLFYNVIKSRRLAWKGVAEEGKAKAVGWEAAGDPLPAVAAPLLWVWGTPRVLLGFYPHQNMKGIPPHEPKF